ncbi:MAG TPA: DEAD/DEAH box helicase, partial [Candidatus Goldiibacteriota bacterium]|nr:DEAD/DEAH box helicase [Candidatus Goldiibacteriota bacterium]
MFTDNQALNKDVQYVKGVGPNRLKLLAKLNIKTVFDLIYYFPYGWMDRSSITPINKVRIGEKEVVKGVVVDKGTIMTRNRLKITQVLIKDEKGYINGVWYNQPYMEKNFNKGDVIMFFGKVEFFRGSFQISTPEYEIIKQKDGNDVDDMVNVNRIVPIYPLTEKISQKQLRKIIKYTLDNYLNYIEEYLPDEIMKKYSFMDLKEALYNIHFPENFNVLENSKKRLKFDEFFILQSAFAIKRKQIKESKAQRLNVNGELYNKILNNLPFRLTSAQERTLNEIKRDLVSGEPMNRLIQGDVGSGKTIVALLTCAIAADSGLQSAIMAPTEILAMQHMKNVSEFVKDTKIRTGLLISGIKKSERQDLIEKIKTGEINIVIGTHALIQEDVSFKNLGLVVIDEQHRFGVIQRKLLRDKGF